jgi:AraC family transcriptional regulator
MEGLQATAPEPFAAADKQFHLVASSLAKLVETARRELGRDQEAAKASLATASHLLQSEIERCSGASGSTRVVWRLGRSFACELTLTAICTAPFTSGISALSRVGARRISHVSSNWPLAIRRMPT